MSLQLRLLLLLLLILLLQDQVMLMCLGWSHGCLVRLQRQAGTCPRAAMQACCCWSCQTSLPRLHLLQLAA
jgi:hypothetical protein